MFTPHLLTLVYNVDQCEAIKGGSTISQACTMYKRINPHPHNNCSGALCFCCCALCKVPLFPPLQHCECTLLHLPPKSAPKLIPQKNCCGPARNNSKPIISQF